MNAAKADHAFERRSGDASELGQDVSTLTDRRDRRAGERVLMVAPQPFYDDRGTPIAIWYVLNALSELGYEIDMLTLPMGAPVEIPGVRILRTRNRLGVRSVPVGFSIRKLLFDGLLCWELHRRLRQERYFCVHAVEEAALYALPLSRRKGVPVIYDMQSSLPEQLATKPWLRTKLLQSALRALERRLLEGVDYVVCSAGLADHVRAIAPSAGLREWHFPSEPPKVPSDEVAALRAELKLPADARVVLYSGNFAPYQGMDILFEATPKVLAAVPNVVMVFVGATSEAELNRRVDGALGARVILLPRQPRLRMPVYMELASVLVSPRNHGGNFPLKIFDYLAAAKPIVATDVPAHRVVLDDSLALLVGNSADAMAQGLIRVLCDHDLARSLAAAAGAYARLHLSWPSFVRSVDEIYSEARGYRALHRGAQAEPRNVAGG